MIAGIVVIVVSAAFMVFRHPVSRFFSWLFRDAPGGGGAYYEAQSSPAGIVYVGALGAAFGALLILDDLGIVPSLS